MNFTRAGGILLHPTSLPGPYGVGDLGQSARNFINFLDAVKLRLWQVLPVNPTGYGNSPYQTLSAFAGNPLLISLDELVADQLLQPQDLQYESEFSQRRIKFQDVIPFHSEKLKLAYKNFVNGQAAFLNPAFDLFCHENTFWLEDYALFIALKEENELQLWTYWPPEIVRRDAQALQEARVRLFQK